MLRKTRARQVWKKTESDKEELYPTTIKIKRSEWNLKFMLLDQKEKEYLIKVQQEFSKMNQAWLEHC